MASEASGQAQQDEQPEAQQDGRNEQNLAEQERAEMSQKMADRGR